MKSIKSYILERKSSSGFQDNWKACGAAKYINGAELLEYALQALKDTNLSASDLSKEVLKYTDEDELIDDIDAGKLEYSKFENKLIEIVSEYNEYKKNAEKIRIYTQDFIYEFLSRLKSLENYSGDDLQKLLGK